MTRFNCVYAGAYGSPHSLVRTQSGSTFVPATKRIIAFEVYA